MKDNCNPVHKGECVAKHQNLKPAFSLIELLISLIIISLVAAVFAPILTHKLNHGNISFSQTSDLSSECKEIDADCNLCFLKQQKCITCNKTCLSNQYLEISTCKCVNCVANCASCNKNECLSCKEDFKLSDDKKSCISLYTGVTKELCTKINAVFIPAQYNGVNGKALCVTKYNAGDSGGASVPGTVQRVNVDHTATPPYPWATNPRCWFGQTAATTYNDACNEKSPRCTKGANYPFNYHPCNRTLCNWSAAKEICSKYSVSNLGVSAQNWRLPKESEFKGWAQNINAISIKAGADGLQFCDRMDGSSSPICHHTHKGCLGAPSGFCIPYAIVGETVTFSLAQNGFSASGFDKVSAYSVRCVIDKVKVQN